MKNLSNTINNISKLLGDDFIKFEENFDKTLESKVKLINKVIIYNEEKRQAIAPHTYPFVCKNFRQNKSKYLLCSIIG